MERKTTDLVLDQKEIMEGSNISTSLRLENVVAVVTGGSRGIGAAIVRRFVRDGARVVFSDLLMEKGKALEEELGKNAAFYRADSMSPSDIEALMNFAVEHFGRLDCVVNNAGAGGEGGPIEQISVEGFDRTIALLLRGTFPGNQIRCPTHARRINYQHRQRGRSGRRVVVASLFGSEVWCCRANKVCCFRVG